MAEEEAKTTEEVKVEEVKEVKKIVKVPKPDKAAHQAKLDDIQKEIEVLNEKTKKLKVEIDAILNNRNGPNKSELDVAKAELGALNNTRKQLMAEKQAIALERDAAREKVNAKLNEEKAARSDLKYHTVEAIDNQIKELERKQKTTSMTLPQEKQMLKDIQSLRMSKKTVASVSEMKESIDKLKSARAALDKSFNEKSLELKAVFDQMTPLRDTVDRLNKSNNENKDAIPALRKEVDKFRNVINTKYDEMKTMRKEFKKSEDAYYAYLNEEKRRKKEEYKKLQEARKLEEEARQKELEAIELAKVPYEDEMNLCDFLVSYLKTKFTDAEKNGAGTSNESKVPETVNGMKIKKRDDEDLFAANTNVKRGKKKGGNNSKKRDIIVHGVDTISSFSALGLVPPNVTSDVQASIDELLKTKEFYKNSERGSVPTMAAKAKETEHKKEEKKKTTSKKQSVFNLEADFPDLTIKDAKTEGTEGAPGLTNEA